MTKQERIEMIASSILGGVVAAAPSWSEAIGHMSDSNIKRALDRAEAMVEMSDARYVPQDPIRQKGVGSASRLAEIDELIHCKQGMDQ